MVSCSNTLVNKPGKPGTGFLALAFLSFIFSMPLVSFAQVSITFGPHQTKIDGSIPYSVIGKYKATFKAFKGIITLDDRGHDIESVYLDIKVSSITSNCPWCDRVVRSRRLLNSRVFPDIIFKSDRIIRGPQGLKVIGIVSMHGIEKRLSFPFEASLVPNRRMKGNALDVKGSWVINRKAFDIYWNRLLDRGGILVGDNITVDWGIRVKISKESV